MKNKAKEDTSIPETQYWWSIYVLIKKEDYKDLDNDSLKKVALLKMEKAILKHMTIKDSGNKGKICELSGKADPPKEAKETLDLGERK